MKFEEEIRKSTSTIYRLVLIIVALTGLIVALLVYYAVDPQLSALTSLMPENTDTPVDDPDKVENGIHLRTGLIEGDGLMAVVNNCTNCHSSKLVIQNRMSKEQWVSTIRWMQATQNLWDLGADEEVIVDYLTTNYPVQKKGRRQQLSNIEWYELED